MIDGGSKDDTISVLKRYSHVKWMSEPDGGQADALNKGFAMSTGDIIGWVNSDDFFEKNIFGSVANALARPGALWAVGNLLLVYMRDGTIVRGRSPEITYEALLRDPDIVRQPSTFFRREALERAGLWDPSLHMVMDYDLWLRVASLAPPVMVDETWAYFRIHEQQKMATMSARRQSREIERVLRRRGVPANRIWQIIGRKYTGMAKWYTKAALIRLGLLDAKYESMPLRG